LGVVEQPGTQKNNDYAERTGDDNIGRRSIGQHIGGMDRSRDDQSRPHGHEDPEDKWVNRDAVK